MSITFVRCECGRMRRHYDIRHGDCGLPPERLRASKQPMELADSVDMLAAGSSPDVYEPEHEGKAAMFNELRDLLSTFLDATVLQGHTVTKEQWERACLLCGRWCPPFTGHDVSGDE